MNTDYLTTLWTGPPFLFISNEMSNAEFSDVLKIVNHAHAILGSIALIQVDEPGAGKAVASEAVLGSIFC